MPSNDTLYADDNFNWTEVPWQDCRTVSFDPSTVFLWIYNLTVIHLISRLTTELCTARIVTWLANLGIQMV